MHDSGALQPIADRLAILEVLTRYATALDHRDWRLLDELFAPDVLGRFGGRSYRGIDAVRAMIRSMLDGCGPTQHLLSNFRIDVAGDVARSVCSVRAFHAGLGAHAGVSYELFGEYRDELARRPEGWRVVVRSMWVSQEIGDRAILGPGPPPPRNPAR